MKNKIIALLLVFAMLLTFAACGGSKVEEEPSDIEIPEESSEIPEEETSEPEEAPEEESSESSNSHLDELLDAYNQNNDVVGWLTVPGTDINEPVVQSSDNDYYLRRTWTKESDKYGCYFADYECNFENGNLPTHTIIYGHSMELNDDPNGTKFSQLKRWLDPEFAKTHPYIHFSTPEKDYVYQIFSVMYTSTQFNYIDPEPTPAEMLSMINEARLSSQYNYPITVDAKDKTIALSTCTYHFTREYPNNYRYVVMARLVEDGETISDTVNLEINAKPKKPPIFK
jgi:sortase B